jgi:2-dehydro-3-deoxyglucarate aldolase/4-hydroxy-2-oxoheptanedioate aldolase
MKAAFSRSIRSGKPWIGTLVTVDSPQIAEVLILSGYDWLFIDMEHAALEVAAVQRLVQVASGRCHSIVRVAENSDVWIKRVLDTGCDGVMVPQVRSAADASRAVRSAKYPPLGERSAGISRAQGFGLAFAEYVGRANSTTSVIVQVEHVEAVENIESILAVEGVDGVFIGPYDLSGSMNRLGEVESDEVQRAITRIRAACRDARMPVGLFVLDADAAKAQIEAGCSFVAVGLDMTTLATAARRNLHRVRS